MKVAVLYTGALRTVQKTIGFFKQHVLRMDAGAEVHVFACVQNDTARSTVEWEAWFRSQMGGHMVSITWFTMAQHEEWIMIREKNLATTRIPPNWKDYLRSSGSFIEYVQMLLAYRQMMGYEEAGGFRYDYLIRMRPDNLFAKPIDFHWLQWDEDAIQMRLDRLRHTMGSVSDAGLLQSFMATIVEDGLMDNVSNLIGEYKPCRSAESCLPRTAAEYRTYLHEGAYILTFRSNNLYIVRRELFYLIPSVAGLYGLLPTPSPDAYWFNAENQFQNACYYSGLSVHDYNTLFEDKCLYEYDEKRYFTGDYAVANPYMMYCVMRY